MFRIFFTFILVILGLMMQNVFSQKATIQEKKMSLKTYPFSDPSPIPQIGRLYPYFRFDGYTDKSIDKVWNMVILENEYIKVFVCPDIGGKIWGAIEKSTGKEFMYYNHVVKFRDVAMRGAWTSGGLEYNFGDIGHIPTCATPVDYKVKENKDGSVSCVVGALDLPSRTNWNVEIRLEKDKAYFETIATWANNSNVPVTYYHWMNAAAKAAGNLEFLYPGSKRIGHGGESGEWPKDFGKKISLYEENNFGIYKSYHIINAYSDYFGGYWHDDDFGFGHLAAYDDKPGKKIWIWGLSDQGMIWEDLLTDYDGQYIEYQSGKLFNQAAHSSTYTPFKHREFMPCDLDAMSEKWFPLKATKGMVAASEYAVLNAQRKENQLNIFLSPLQPLNDQLIVRKGEDTLLNVALTLSPLDLYTKTLEIKDSENFEILLGDHKLKYISDASGQYLERPIETNKKFNWETAYGMYIQALEFEKQRRYTEALEMYIKSYDKDPTFIPTLDRIALSYYRIMNYQEALKYAKLSLSIDTYGALGNYVYGLIQAKNNRILEAKSSLSIAAQSVAYRSASYTELAKLFLRENDFANAKHYLGKALTFNTKNIAALEMLAIVYRKTGNEKVHSVINQINTINSVNHFTNAEKLFSGLVTEEYFKSQITNELPFETYLELALKYKDYKLQEEAVTILKMAPENPIVLLWLSSLEQENSHQNLKKALDLPIDLIFPHRTETAEMLQKMIKKNSHWKLKYYLSLFFWNKGLFENAKSLISFCGNEPNSFVFYLTKAKLFSGNEIIVDEAVESALNIAPSEWRINKIKAERLLMKSRFSEAKKIASKFMKLYPENAQFGMLYAKSLLGMNSYEKCIDFLKEFQVLPYEGSTEGRNMYYKACIKAACNMLQKRNYLKAIDYARKAKIWPKNLGVGKHYDVDQRLDNYIIAFSMEHLGKQLESEQYYRIAAEHITPNYLSESSKLYLQLKALEKIKNKEKALQLLKQIRKNDKYNEYVQWAEMKYKFGSASNIEAKILNSSSEIQAYDTKFIDSDFQLILDFIQTIQL